MHSKTLLQHEFWQNTYSQHMVLVFSITVWKVSKYGVFSGLYFPAFISNKGKYGLEKAPHLDTWMSSCLDTPQWYIKQQNKCLNEMKSY